MIDREEELKGLIPRVRAAAWVAVDTEADSLHAYPEKLCLLQLSLEDGDFLIDPLAGIPMESIFAALKGHELLFHAADYDLRLLAQHHRFVPTSVFDTMLAARLVGLTQFGLAHLVDKFLGVKLDKAPQRANWAMRPLTERMSRYAINDTHHLKPLADQLRGELEAKGRLSWHREWCAQLIEECAAQRTPDPDQVWRIKGSAILPPRALGVLRELWRWRESEAVSANRPPYFVLAHDRLLRIAAAAASHEKLDEILPAGMSRRRREGAAEAVRRGLALPKAGLPEPFKPTHRRPSEAERRRFLELERRRDKHAKRLSIDPTLIASRADLARLAHDWAQHSPELMQWQLEPLQ